MSPIIVNVIAGWMAGWTSSP